MVAISRSRRASAGNSLASVTTCPEERVADRARIGGLLEPYAEEFARLVGRRLERWVGLQDQVAPALLLADDLKRAGLVAGGDDAVGDFAAQHAGERGVDRLADGGEVAVCGGEVAPTGPHVGDRGWRELVIGQQIGGAERVVERSRDGGAGRADVLERGRGREPGRGAEFADQLPGAERVEHVDVARLAIQHLERQRVADRLVRGGALVRVVAVAERLGHRRRVA